MHRLIMGAGPGDHVDHKNEDGGTDGLNNADWNLRICSQSENMCNRGATKANKSGYKGVYWIEEKGRYRAEIKFERKTTNLGYFDCKHDAAEAYNAAAIRLHGPFARLNVIVRDEAA